MLKHNTAVILSSYQSNWFIFRLTRAILKYFSIKVSFIFLTFSLPDLPFCKICLCYYPSLKYFLLVGFSTPKVTSKGCASHIFWAGIRRRYIFTKRKLWIYVHKNMTLCPTYFTGDRILFLNSDRLNFNLREIGKCKCFLVDIMNGQLK